MVVFVEIDGHASLSTDDIDRLPEEAAECGARVAQYLAYDSTLGFAVRAHIAGPQVIRFWSLVVIAVGVAMSSASGAQAACSAATTQGTSSAVACGPVGHEQPFVVPAGVRTLHVLAFGARGGGYGGGGGQAAGDLQVSAGATLYVLVGGVGGVSPEGGFGGFNGGGNGSGDGAGGGGGATDVRTCSTGATTCDTLASRLIIAGGGGGGGGVGSIPLFSSNGTGGSVGANGLAGGGLTAGGGGGGGEAGGGAGGPGAMAGVSGAGGAGGPGGGGGGGGRFGGGGGGPSGDLTYVGPGGGGAGASFGPAGTTFAPAGRSQGLVLISYATPPAVDTRPAVRITRPRRAATVSRRALVVRGRATDPSGVQAVALRIERLPRRAGRCTWLDAAAGLVRTSCGVPPSLDATLARSGSWVYRVPRKVVLSAGRYRVTAYGRDESGIYGNSAPFAARSITFRLSKR
jgi:hypothetical protein